MAAYLVYMLFGIAPSEKTREAAIRRIVNLHLDACSTEGYRAKIVKRGWELKSPQHLHTGGLTGGNGE